MLRRWTPGLVLVRRYRRQWLGRDLLAALALTGLLVPQGMAYAELAGLPPVTGLYTSVIALLGYALFGPSPILVVGPDSALGPMIAAAILPLVGAEGDPARGVGIGGFLALMMGLCCFIAGVGRAGAVTELLSRPVRVGYLNGLAIVILVSQLPKLFGFSTSAHGLGPEARSFFSGIDHGQAVPAALGTGLGCLVVIMAVRLWRPRAPGVFLAVVAATLVVAAFDLSAHGVPVLGVIPSGFPAPALPGVGLHDSGRLALAALGMAFVSVADTSALSRSLAARRGSPVDQNQELVALGVTNMVVSFFQGFPVSASASRTVVAETSGSRTQLTGALGGAAILVLLTAAPGLLKDLPDSALAAIVIAAAFGLLDLGALVWLWKVRKSELLLSLAALAGVAVLGVLPGIPVAIALSLAEFVRRQWRPHSAVLGRIRGRKGYHDVGRHPEAVQIPGLAIYRFDAPLFFANADFFTKGVKAAIASRPDRISWVVLAAEPVTDIDTTGAEALSHLMDQLNADGVQLVFAGLKGPVKDRLRVYGLYDRLGDKGFYSTLGTAVDGYLDVSGVEWVDWSDEAQGS
ncbi:MAG TPA: sulfate permease [Acidimicrobiales bacterium]|nr:sulfate permease [Acidimicrobiales bacterium]